MPNYQNTKIYKIWSPNTEQVYIGATVQSLSMRMAEHRKPTSTTSSSKIIIGLGDAKIELIEEFPCNNKMESDKKEGEYIRSLDCVNKQIAGRTGKEYAFDNKEKINEYMQKNKEYFNKKQREYRKNNVEKVKEQKKNQRNTDAQRESHRQYINSYRQNNLEKVREQERARYAIKRAKAKLATIDELI
tara:strand:+ start:25 stop:588 length:564 start_codon:yes stop_codon:yes gene_type:complete